MNGTYLMAESISSLEERLEKEGFMRVHRSYLVNIDDVHDVLVPRPGTLELRLERVDATVPVSRRRTAPFVSAWDCRRAHALSQSWDGRGLPRVSDAAPCASPGGSARRQLPYERSLMPALITHHLFGEESMCRLPQGIISTEDERCAFLIANQGPDPFFFHVRTPNLKSCMSLGHRMHSERIPEQLAALRSGVEHLNQHDAGVGRAFVLGLLSHYVLDRNAHPFVYAQQWGVQEADTTLAEAGDEVHAIIESDLDVLMLQRKRNGATVADYPPESELVTTERINKVAGALTSYMALSVYGLDVGANEYGGAWPI